MAGDVYSRPLRPAIERAAPSLEALILVSLIGFSMAVYSMLHLGRSPPPLQRRGAYRQRRSRSWDEFESKRCAGRMAEEVFLKQPEVLSTTRRTGRAHGDEHAMGVHASETRSSPARPRAGSTLESVRDALGDPGVALTSDSPSHTASTICSPACALLSLSVVGPRLNELRRLAKQTESIITDVRGLVDLRVEEQRDVPMITPSSRPSRATA